MMYVLTENCQWQDYVIADDLNMLRKLQVRVSDATTLKPKQAAVDFPVVPNPFQVPMLVLQFVHWLCINMCLYTDDAIVACIVILSGSKPRQIGRIWDDHREAHLAIEVEFDGDFYLFSALTHEGFHGCKCNTALSTIHNFAGQLVPARGM